MDSIAGRHLLRQPMASCGGVTGSLSEGVLPGLNSAELRCIQRQCRVFGMQP